MRRFWLILAVGVAVALLWTAYLFLSNGDSSSRSAVPGVEPRADGPPVKAPVSPAPPVPFQLRDVTEETGITYRHTDGSSGKYYIPETVTAGLATFDFDGDSLIDIYFPNGAPLPGTDVTERPRHALYRNLGGWHFEDVTESAGVVCREFGMGAAVADFDQDGFADLYVSNFGPKVLYRNNGDGTFADVSKQASVADGQMLGAGVCFLDAERDGDLDLFVANYLEFSYDKHVVLNRYGYPEYVGPTAYPPEKLTLYRNEGDGTFSDANRDSGVGRYPGKGMGVVAADYDRDGDTDIFVLNDVFQNFCLQNDGTGRFEDVALLCGFKYNGDGIPLGSMGVDCADYDNDGWLDFYQTSYQREFPVLRRNLGNGILEDITVRSGAGQGTLHNVKWGCGFVDFDNDSHRDLFVAMGHLHDTIEHWDPPTTREACNVLLQNTGKGAFVDVSTASGDGMRAKFSSRGAAFDDLDNDGDIDAVILNSRDRPTLLRNMLSASVAHNHWLQIGLRGTVSNRDGVGARIEVQAGNTTLVDEVHAGRGYQGHFGSRVHFGLGRAPHVERVEVYWIGGAREAFVDIAADQFVTLLEGSGQPMPSPPASTGVSRE